MSAPGDLNLFDNGYTVLGFPGALASLVRNQITDYIRSSLTKPIGISSSNEEGGDDELTDLTARVLALSDADYIAHFRKGIRTLPDEISTQFVSWLKDEIAPRLHADEIALTYVCDADRAVNTTLSPKSYDVYWRIVRPNKPDVSSPHTDRAFAKLNEGSDRAISVPFEYTARWRLWVPILGCDAANSLQFIPGSQFEELPIEMRETSFGPRPNVSKEWLADNDHRFVCPFDEFEQSCVLFPDTVIHRGPLNSGGQLRLSIDFTVVVR
jgi:hypothetical protein